MTPHANSPASTLDLRITPSRAALGKAAAADIAADLRIRLGRQQNVRIIFAAAPSQSEMLAELVLQPGIDWSRITAFHMDEYIGLAPGTPQLFGEWLRQTIFDRVAFQAVHLIQPGKDLALTCNRYAELLHQAPIDLCLLGIGSNGHLAFNDPPAKLDDPATVKAVELDDECRQQQVDDECFARIEDVPTHAITLTVPTLLAADRLFCCIPGKLKAEATRAMVQDEISGLCPATALRQHPRCTIYLDTESASLLG
jgi:glucosamine-6-phosphate deaminase